MLLYEVSIVVSKIAGRKRKEAAPEESETDGR